VTQRPKNVLYIAGSGRSGSTLVERTLGSIPAWVNVGELIELFRKPSVSGELCGCGEPFENCEFWSEVGRLAFGSWSSDTIARVGSLQRQLSRQRYLPRLLLTGDDSESQFADTLREYGAIYDTLYDAIATVADADVVVDASKWPGQALALQRVVSPEMSLLHLVRDPRGVAYSWSKTHMRRPHGGDSDSVMATHKSRATAGRWAAFQSEIALIRPVFEHSARLRYEDFINDPRGRLTSILGELGLGSYAERLEHVHRDRLDLPQSHGVAGNPSRFKHGVVELRADEAWREKLPVADRRLVTAVTTPWLLRYGYPLHVEPPSPPPPDTSGITDWPTVAVILPTRGRPELVREAVLSVIEQDYAGDIDVMVVHDQEEPQTELKEFARNGRTVTLLNNTHAEGLAGARNTGLDNTSAAYIASCDDDDFWDTDKLRLQMARMLAEPDLSVLGAGIRLLMGEDQVVEWPGDSPVVTRAQLLRSRRKELHSSTLLIRSEVFDQVGGYDETLPSSYAEDYEFLLRAVETGRIGVVNTPLASIRKYNASWFRERAEVVSEALEYVLATHPQISESRAGHARVLGQIAFAKSTMGKRKEALKIAGQAFRRWPVAPHAALAVVHSATGIDPRVLLSSVRKAGRGIT
jgi:glycosyltransferase involved in cell wall biosynthesis